MTKELSIIAVVSAMSVFATNAYSAMVEIDNMKTRSVVQVETKTLKDEAPSYLPAGKKWKLVWHDEFNGKIGRAHV